MDNNRNLLIYVVEDNKMYNRLVCEYLKKQNFTNVRSFSSGKECLEAVRAGYFPDIIIQDYHLDDINGIEVLKKVKSYNRYTEFIFLSVNEDVEVAVNAVKLGAYDFIIKNNDVELKKVGIRVEKIAREIAVRNKNNSIKKLMVFSVMILFAIVLVVILLFLLGIIDAN